jgi:MFS family permease
MDPWDTSYDPLSTDNNTSDLKPNNVV